ncbi:MAG: hypothetical protein JNM20_19870 [Rhizobiales bacterium]|nr:hypothetical protein [Hyphomicrobiales bacterium]
MFCSTTLAVMSLFGLAETPPMTGLPAHIGKYPFEQVQCLSFFEEPLVSKAITAAAGDSALSFIESLDAAAPVVEKEDALIAVACEEGNCNRENAAVAITPFGTLVALCLYSAKGNHGAGPGITRWVTEKREHRLSAGGADSGCPHDSDQFIEAYARARL